MLPKVGLHQRGLDPPPTLLHAVRNCRGNSREPLVCGVSTCQAPKTQWSSSGPQDRRGSRFSGLGGGKVPDCVQQPFLTHSAGSGPRTLDVWVISSYLEIPKMANVAFRASGKTCYHTMQGVSGVAQVWRAVCRCVQICDNGGHKLNHNVPGVSNGGRLLTPNKKPLRG